jgi:hypothetical protein
MFPRWVDSTHVDFRHSFLQPSTDGTSAPLLRSNSWLVAACRRTNAAVQYVCRFQHWFWSVKSVLPISRFSPCSWSGKFLEVETRWSGKFLCSFAFELRSFAFYVWSFAFYVWSFAFYVWSFAFYVWSFAFYVWSFASFSLWSCAGHNHSNARQQLS